MNIWLLLGITLFISLIIIAIICFFIHIIYRNMNNLNKIILFLFCLFGTVVFILIICMLWYIQLSHYPISLHYHFTYEHLYRLKSFKLSINDPLIAYLMDFIAFIFASPILLLVIVHIYEYVKNNLHFLPILFSIIDIIIIGSILYVYLIRDNNLRIYGHAHCLFPLVLMCVVASLCPAILDVYIRIINDTNINLRNYHMKIVKNCCSGLINMLSMLGIALTFDSLSFTANWPVSVGFIYWGTYIFVIVSLTLIDFDVVYNIRAS